MFLLKLTSLVKRNYAMLFTNNTKHLVKFNILKCVKNQLLFLVRFLSERQPFCARFWEKEDFFWGILKKSGLLHAFWKKSGSRGVRWACSMGKF